jgi:hypothetical protein
MPLTVIVFNVNGIGRQRYEVSKQLQDLYIYVALFSETHLKREFFFIFQITNPIQTTATRAEKAASPLQLEKESLTAM